MTTPKQKKNTVDGLNFLGVGDFTCLITSIKFSRWGENVLINCIYNSPERLNYSIAFSGCYKIKWFMLDSEIAEDIEADVFDFQIHKDEQGEYAYFHTDIFDILIHYKSMEILKNW
jgi:hypothetical protein